MARGILNGSNLEIYGIARFASCPLMRWSGPCSRPTSKRCLCAAPKTRSTPWHHAKGQGRQHQDDNGRTGHLHAGLARLFRLLRNARGADSPHALGPTAAAGRSVAPMENPTAPPRGTHRKWGLRVGCKEHGRQRPRSLVSRPQQSSLYWALKCILQIARPAILVPIVLA